jgi:F420-non-reducing hydrogenase iron-sulfur subunit
VEYAGQLLETIGLEPQRLQMINISSAMAGEFTDRASQVTQTIRELGPNPLRNGNVKPGAAGEQEIDSKEE